MAIYRSITLDTEATYSVIPKVFYENYVHRKLLLNTNWILKLYNGENVVLVGYLTSEIYFREKMDLNIQAFENGESYLINLAFFNLDLCGVSLWLKEFTE